MSVSALFIFLWSAGGAVFFAVMAYFSAPHWSAYVFVVIMLIDLFQMAMYFKKKQSQRLPVDIDGAKFLLCEECTQKWGEEKT